MLKPTNIGGLVEAGSKKNPSSGKMSFYYLQLALRVLVIAFTLAGAVLTTTSRETVIVFRMTMTATYADSTSLKYKAVADSIACALSVLSVVLVIALNGPKLNSRNYFYLLLTDLVSQIVLLSGCAAATAVGYVAKFGQKQSGWGAICDHVAKFCNKLAASIGVSYLAVIILVALIVMSGCKLKSVTSS